jgi:hypothetical protein
MINVWFKMHQSAVKQICPKQMIGRYAIQLETLLGNFGTCCVSEANSTE